MVVPIFLEINDTHRVGGLLGVFLQVLLRQPALYARTTLVGFYQSDGNVQRLIHHFGEEITRCREFTDRLWRALTPVGLSILLRSHSHDAGNLGRTHLTLASSTEHLLVVVQHRTVAKSLHRHLHVRLTSTYPYLAREYIINSNLTITIVEGDAQRLVRCLRRLHRQQPPALLVGLSLSTLIRPRCGSHHLTSRFVPSPQTHIRLLLDNHIVTYQMVQFHFSLQANSQCCKCSQRKHSSIHCSRDLSICSFNFHAKIQTYFETTKQYCYTIAKT